MKQTQILTVLALTGAFALSVTAQDQPKPQLKPLQFQLQVVPGVAGGALGRPAFQRVPQLDLTEEQKTKIAKLRKAQNEARRKLFQNKDLTPQDKRDQSADLRAEYQKKIEALYTKEQKAQLAKAKKAQAERQEQMKKLRIVLTKDQRAQVQKLSAKRQEDYKATRELPQAERRAAYQKLAKEYQKDYEAILTDEQKAKQKKMRELFGGRGGFGAGGIRILPAPGGVLPRKIQPRNIKPLKIQPKLFELKPRQTKPLKRDKIS